MNGKRVVVAAIAAWTVFTAARIPGAAASRVASQTSTADTAAVVRPILDRYCVTCHNTRLKTAGLTLDTLDLSDPQRNGEILEKVIRKVRGNMMPPLGVARPDDATRERLVSTLITQMDALALEHPNPGRPVLHRLNRAEYANAIRDLLALEVDTTVLLPPDDSSSGFDNNADVLGVSPSLQERYLAAANTISALAVSDPRIEPSEDTYAVRGDVSQFYQVEGLPFGTRGGLLISHTFPLDGEYQIKVKLWRTNLGITRGLGFPHTVVILVDGKEVLSQSVGSPADQNAMVESLTAAADAIDARLQVRVPLKAGPRTIGVTFVQKTDAESPTLLQPFVADFDFIDGDPTALPKIDVVKIAGPFNATPTTGTPSRRRIFTCRPGTRQAGGAAGSSAEETACARTILRSLARQAYRRPVSSTDLQVLLDFYERGRRGRTFDAGIQLALKRLLTDPQFIFRVEEEPPTVASGSSYRLGDYDLAARLSFFLWSTSPDATLLAAAGQARLRDRPSIDTQVRRMLLDPRARALVDNFAGQWLYLRNLKSVAPNSNEFPDFDDNLRQAFRRETELLFKSIIDEDRSVVDLLSADYTFVNERLARHYGIPNIYGSEFRRVPVVDEARRGILGHGSILTVTSRPERTSPVLRGKWILDNLLGTPPPPPPPNVPPLMASAGETRPRTLRAQMEAHRANPACASCHRVMDPLGFALENFDGVGAWRTRDGANAIDASGQFADGTSFAGVVDLRRALLRHPEVFVQTMTEKLMTYALGRGLEYYDMPVVRAIVRDAAAADYRFSSLVLGIVNSTPFQMRVKALAAEPARNATR